MSKQMTKLMPWVGGKAQLMWAIQMLLPTHYKTLVDVFGGSGIITLNTAVPSGCLQIYNDLNHDLYNLLFCAKERPLELVRELGFLPINAHDEFDVLQRVCKANKIHMESSFTPVYNSAYIEGIHNLYEFDVGKLSG